MHHLYEIAMFWVGFADGTLIYAAAGLLPLPRFRSWVYVAAWMMVAILFILLPALSCTPSIADQGVPQTLAGLHLILGALAVGTRTLDSILLERSRKEESSNVGEDDQ